MAHTLMRPVLIIDEAQETPTTVLNELHVLASKELDSRQLLCVVFAGDAQLTDRLRTLELLPSPAASAVDSSSRRRPATSCAPASTISSMPRATRS